MKKYLIEVEATLKKLGRKYSKKDEQYLRDVMVKTKRYSVFKLSKTNKLKFKKYNFSFADLPKKQQAKIWCYIFKNTNSLEVGDRALYFFRMMKFKPKDELQQYWAILKPLVGHIENWVHGDMLASVLNHIYTYKHAEMDSQLKKWIHHKSPWKRRMGLLTLLYYYRSKRYLPNSQLIEESILAQMNVDHYYLQKALGWTAREYFSAYPKKGLMFIRKHLFDFTPVAYSTAVERVDSKLKKEFAKRRAMQRKLLRIKNC